MSTIGNCQWNNAFLRLQLIREGSADKVSQFATKQFLLMNKNVVSISAEITKIKTLIDFFVLKHFVCLSFLEH
jgi:hypothetical protein